MHVRPASGLDETAVLDVLRADGETTGRQPSKARLLRVRDKLRSPTALTLVAEDDGKVVGFLHAELARTEGGTGAVEPGLLHLSLLCVAPEHRRGGAGRALVAALLERFGHVTAWAPDGPGRLLLEQAGFRSTGETGEVRGEPAFRLRHDGTDGRPGRRAGPAAVVELERRLGRG